MKKVINGRLYNTETARYVGAYDNGCGAGDFNHLYEELYVKKTGEFFLYGCGGANSKYAKTDEHGWRSGTEVLVPLTLSQAKHWIEEHLSADTYIEFFDVEE